MMFSSRDDSVFAARDTTCTTVALAKIIILGQDWRPHRRKVSVNTISDMIIAHGTIKSIS